jgi:hypothetical protein
MITLVIVLVALLLLGMPVAFSMGLAPLMPIPLMVVEEEYMDAAAVLIDEGLL